MKKIYGMILSHNCEKLLPLALEKIPQNYFTKIFITDDGSIDNSVEVGKSLGLDVVLSEEKGYGANVKNGIKYAFDNDADYVVEIHGDGAQFNPNAIIPAIEFINSDYDFIIGSRLINIKRSIELKIPYPRLIANIILSYFDRIILKLPFSEFHTGFRIYSKKFSNVNFENYSNGYLFSFEVMALAAFLNMKCAEVPVECDYKSEHTSHSYLGASIYAISHFKTLFDFYLSKKTNLKVGIFQKT